ncbi:hypothetical protein WI26_03350 [Burkholderia diffusa]|nr:hypothetical protein WI26_03350 [Burkholderia diffusa]
MQMVSAIDTQTDTVVGVRQIVFTAQIKCLEIVCLQITAYDTQCMSIDVKSRDLFSLMSQNTVMAKDNRIDRIPSPSIT